MELTGSWSASGGLSNTYAEPVFKAHRVGAHSTDRITRARFVKDSSNLTYLQIYIAGGVNNNTWGKSVLEYNIGAYSQNTADSGSAAMFEAGGSVTNIRTLEVDDNAICVNAGSHKFYSGGGATERLRILSDGETRIIGNDTKGLKVTGQSWTESDDYSLIIIGNDETNPLTNRAGARIIAPHQRRMYFELRANDDTDHFAWLGNPDYDTGVADTILMELHPKGYLQTPLQPSFMATFGGNNNVSHDNGDYLKANSTDHNTGNCYSTSNYRFTAPVAGNYLFYGRANMSGAGSGDYSRSFQVRLFKNGSAEQFHMSRTTLTGYSGSYPDTSTMVCSINLAANDYVQLKVNWETDGSGISSTETLHHHGSMFGGYLIG